MTDIKLFRLLEQGVEPIQGSTMAIEKSLQTLVEQHLEAFLGVRFLASEYSTTRSHGGRIDTLGIDESNSPVIVEYKRTLNENVINQGLFYLNWLMDHRADFRLLVMDKLGAELAGKIEWRYPRLICIASDFTKYDEHAIQQIPRNIDLIRYRRYGDDLILLERFATSSVTPPPTQVKIGPSVDGPTEEGQKITDATPLVIQRFNQCSAEVQDWFHTLEAFMLGLGEGVEARTQERYIAFRHLKNFAYVRFRPTLNRIVVDLVLDPATVAHQDGFARSLQGKWAQIEIDSAEDVERAQPLIMRSYQEV